MSVYDILDEYLAKIDKLITNLINSHKKAKSINNGYSTFTNFLELIGLTGTYEAADNINNFKVTLPIAFIKSIRRLAITLIIIVISIILFLIIFVIAFSILALSLTHPLVMICILYLILLFIALWIKTDGYIVDDLKDIIIHIKNILERKIEGIINGKKKNL